MKYSARLVTALAALALLAVAIIGPTATAQASTSPPAPEMASVVQSIDLPGTLDLEGGGAGILATTQIDVTTFDDPTTPAFTLVAEHDVGTLDTSLTLVVDQTVSHDPGEEGQNQRKKENAGLKNFLDKATAKINEHKVDTQEAWNIPIIPTFL